QKTVTVMQNADTITVPSGRTLELKGQGVGSNETLVRRDTTFSGSEGYSIDVAGAIDAQYYTISYLKGPTDGYGLDLQSGATVTNLANGTFNNYKTVTANDAFVRVHSNLIGTGTPTQAFSTLTFTQSGGQPEWSIAEAGGTAGSGYWNFPN